jgi:3-isopropylmalate dehydratase small subunit
MIVGIESTDRGFRAVVAPSFARIFFENAYNNGIAP